MPPLVLLAAVACAGRGSPSRTPELRDNTEVGKASWYGRKFHGRPTASGERFDMRELTAAHRTLPFGTQVRVTNLENNRSVVVRINDRGPFVGDRIIDLSRAAARQISMIERGVVRVRIRVMRNSGKS